MSKQELERLLRLSNEAQQELREQLERVIKEKDAEIARLKWDIEMLKDEKPDTLSITNYGLRKRLARLENQLDEEHRLFLSAREYAASLEGNLTSVQDLLEKWGNSPFNIKSGLECFHELRKLFPDLLGETKPADPATVPPTDQEWEDFYNNVPGAKKGEPADPPEIECPLCHERGPRVEDLLDDGRYYCHSCDSTFYVDDPPDVLVVEHACWECVCWDGGQCDDLKDAAAEECRAKGFKFFKPRDDPPAKEVKP